MFYKNILFYGVWLLLTIPLAYWFSYPLDTLIRHHSFGAAESTLGLWILNWQLSQLSSGNLDQLFTGNSLYPLDRPILLSPPSFSTVVLTLPVFLVTQDPYTCYGVAIFSSHVLSSLGMLLLARRLRLDRAAALLAAMIFTFSESRYGFSATITLTQVQWMPFTLLCVHKYFDEGRRIFLYWASLFYLMQVTASAYHGIFFSMILLLFVCVLVYQQDNLKFKKFALDIASPILIVGTVASIYFTPYLQEAHEFGFERSIVEQSVYGAPLASFLSSPSSHFLSPWTSHFRHIDGSISPRYLPILLTAVALLIIRKNTLATKILLPLKLRSFGVGVIFLTLVLWFFKNSITTLGQKIYPDLVLHPQLVSTVLLTPLFLAMIACFFRIKFFRKIYQGLRAEKIFLLYFSVATLAFVVSLGPIIKLYENQHIMVNPIATFLYYAFPGFSSIRGISRMAVLIPLGLGITSGIAYMLIKVRLDKPLFKKIFSCFVFTLFLLEIYPAKGFHVPYKQVENKLDEVYLWLKEIPEGPVMEWPITTQDLVYLERSITHRQRLVNGLASFEWDGSKKLAELTDLSSKRALLSLYAFGVRYLVVHRIGGSFPEWAGKNLGKFQRVQTFDNALVYLNKDSTTNFLPKNFIDYFSASVENANDKNRLILRFNSPSVYYVSKNKKQLKVKVKWKSNSTPSYYGWSFYPTLWQDGDTYELVLDENSDRVLESAELIYSAPEKKSIEIFRKIEFS